MRGEEGRRFSVSLQVLLRYSAVVGARGNVTSQNDLSLAHLARLLRRLGPPERETVEMLLDERFTRTVLRRGREVRNLRNKGKLLSLAHIKKASRR